MPSPVDRVLGHFPALPNVPLHTRTKEEQAYEFVYNRQRLAPPEVVRIKKYCENEIRALEVRRKREFEEGIKDEDWLVKAIDRFHYNYPTISKIIDIAGLILFSPFLMVLSPVLVPGFYCLLAYGLKKDALNEIDEED